MRITYYYRVYPESPRATEYSRRRAGRNTSLRALSIGGIFLFLLVAPISFARKAVLDILFGIVLLAGCVALLVYSIKVFPRKTEEAIAKILAEERAQRAQQEEQQRFFNQGK